jgi:nucleoside-diphosphate-sugar epimerase
MGAHLVRALEDAGYDVRRDWVDMPDRSTLERAVRSCDSVAHVAALYSFTAPASEIEAVNVDGTRNVIAACRAANVKRLVYTSARTPEGMPPRYAPLASTG